jgi:pimeloyl-ACP methyl ester carboxylesterase
VTLVQGTRDDLAPMWMHRRWRRALPDAQANVLRGFPHHPQLP